MLGFDRNPLAASGLHPLSGMTYQAEAALHITLKRREGKER